MADNKQQGQGGKIFLIQLASLPVFTVVLVSGLIQRNDFCLSPPSPRLSGTLAYQQIFITMITDLGTWPGGILSGVTDTVGKGVSGVTDTTGNAVSGLGKGVGDTLSGVTEGVGNTAKGAGSTVSGMTSSVGGATGGAAGDATQKADDSFGGKKQTGDNPLGL